jgi:hypothetical protein
MSLRSHWQTFKTCWATPVPALSTIQKPGGSHPDITKLGDSEHCSTSIGVIEIDGKFWLIADIGFRECAVS